MPRHSFLGLAPTPLISPATAKDSGSQEAGSGSVSGSISGAVSTVMPVRGWASFPLSPGAVELTALTRPRERGCDGAGAVGDTQQLWMRAHKG